MTKRQLIDEILERNSTADPGFLARFDDEDLDDYLTNLRRLQAPRLSGNAERYEKYFVFNTPAQPRQESASACPCLPVEEAEVDDSFWHLDQDFEAEDEELRRRVDRFAEQLIDSMSDKGDLPADDDFDDDGGSVLYSRTDPSLDDLGDDSLEEDTEDDESYQTTVRSDSSKRDEDAWLF
jgi:hypothetical protein